MIINPYVFAGGGGGPITESFDQADSNTLGPDLSWTEIEGNSKTISNTLQHDSDPATAYADTDLGSDDNYAQIVVDALSTSSGSDLVIILCRMPGTSARTGYGLRVTRVDAGSVTARLERQESGSTTVIDSGGTFSGSLPATIRVEVSGTSVSGSVDDGTTTLTLGPVTDSNITSGPYAGVLQFGGEGDVIADDFEAGVL